MENTLEKIETGMTNDGPAFRAGVEIVKLLALPRNHRGIYDTDWGDKTEAGLARSIARILLETE